MQQRAGLLFLSRKTKKILLIHENQKWTVPTFIRKDSLIVDANPVLEMFSTGKIIPIELYHSEDKGFEYGTYVCLVSDEFLIDQDFSYAWINLSDLPKNLHNGLKQTLNNNIIRTKIETILELENASTNY